MPTPLSGTETAFGGLQSTTAALFGTLLGGKQDDAGTQYRRNRAYDPATGRFTQEDPLGFGGGINLYAYAGGDPINSHDPYGLSYGLITSFIPDDPDPFENGTDVVNWIQESGDAQHSGPQDGPTKTQKCLAAAQTLLAGLIEASSLVAGITAAAEATKGLALAEKIVEIYSRQTLSAEDISSLNSFGKNLSAWITVLVGKAFDKGAAAVNGHSWFPTGFADWIPGHDALVGIRDLLGNRCLR